VFPVAAKLYWYLEKRIEVELKVRFEVGQFADASTTNRVDRRRRSTAPTHFKLPLIALCPYSLLFNNCNSLILMKIVDGRVRKIQTTSS